MTNPTLLLLPGLASDNALFTAQCEAIAATGREVLVSDVHFRYATLPEMARALLAEHAGPLLLCGASMGGMLAFEAVRQASNRVQGLALLGSSARPDTPEIAQLRAQAVAMIEGGSYEDMIAGNVYFSVHASRFDDEALVAAYLDMLRRAGPGQLVQQNIAVAARADSRPLLASVRCPTLVACGDDDRVTTLAASREIADAIAGAEFTVIERCGHMLTMERPAEVNALLLGWLERHFPLQP